MTNLPFPFCFSALSFLPKGIGGVFVDYRGYNKEYSEFVHWIFVFLTIKITLQFFTFLPNIFNLQKFYFPVCFICNCTWAMPQAKKGLQKVHTLEKTIVPLIVYVWRKRTNCRVKFVSGGKKLQITKHCLCISFQ